MADQEASPTRLVQNASVIPEAPFRAETSDSQTQLGSVLQDCPDCPDLVVIPAGRFMMGSNDSYKETPFHPVSITQFAIGKTEVTQAQWQAVMGSNPSHFKNCGPSCPVELVSWYDTQQFIQRLNAKTGQSYRLSSEAEWEYAARAGSQSNYSFGDNGSQVVQHAWNSENSGRTTKPVAGKQANAFGLNDMLGNVREWTQDCSHDNYRGAPTDGCPWTTNCSRARPEVGPWVMLCSGEDRRVLRGGACISYPAGLRSARRTFSTPDCRLSGNGSRIAKTLVTP